MNADFFTAISAINDEDDYVKAGNYWRWLKRKLSGDGVQLVSVTHDFKFEAPDGGQKNGETVRETAPDPDGGQKNGETVRETVPDPDGGAARKVPYILIVAVISSSKLRSRSR